ncbi:hypothetical protein OG455_12820 [Kitasatospora sp. NBC_01287]|uniref:hypothetical protein n=1 Tax=Kitasatospora sp. NBC_01287 TaxID=2903573 RepID=UPI00224FA559|nr:hypothetical protein [Kitasatospora sp. NBC_01287]MCX4746396.1 hypothetical protein [Kitasatospora sp. NBC_01287]
MLSAPVSKDQMIAALKSLLPPGGTSSPSGRRTADDGDGVAGEPFAGLLYDDGHGEAQVTVDLGRPYPSAAVTSCPDKTLVSYDNCTTGRQPDNSVLTVVQGYVHPDKRLPTKQWDAYLVRPDGGIFQ